MHTSIPEQTGLTQKQAAIYLALLELGEASMTALTRKAGLKHATTYLIIEELILLGLVSATQKGKRKSYSAVHPRRLLEMARFKEQQVKSVLPELVALHNAPKEKPKIQVFEGLEGMKAVYQEVYQSLNNQEEALWFARINALREHVPDALSEFKKLLRQIRNPKIRELNYGDEGGKLWAEETKRLRGKNHHVRILPTKFEFGFSDNLIFGNKLVVFSFKENTS